jgi:hypothetical protein
MNEGTLLRLLDGELPPAERRAADAHLTACAACAAELEALRERARRVRAALDAAVRDVPVPPFPRAAVAGAAAARRAGAWRGPLRAAAAVTLAAGLALAAPPVRDFVRGLAGAPARPAGDDVPAPPPAPGPAAAPALGGSAGAPPLVEFAPDGPDLVLEFDAAPRAGSLVVAVRDTPTVALSASADVGAAGHVVVLPAGLRVRTTAATAADYRVVVPASLRSVRVRVGGAAALALRDAELVAGRDVRVPLARGGRE